MSPLLLPMLAQAAAVPMPPRMSLFFQCQVHAPDETATHEFNLVYFSDPPPGARGFNLRDPDAILPVGAKPKLANAWPTALLITFEGASSPARVAATAFQPVWGSPGRATIVLDRDARADDARTHFTGDCSFTEGDAAEKQFMELTQ